MWRPNMFSRVNNTSQNIITTATTQEYGRIYSYMYTAAITGHVVDFTSRRKLGFYSLWNNI